MTTLYDVKTKIKEIIENNITDLNTYRRRDSKSWVHTDFPRFDSQKPRIGIINVNAPAESLAVNTTKRRQSPNLQLSFLVDSNNTFVNPDTNKYMNADETLEYLSEKVIDLINANTDIINMSEVHWITFIREGGAEPNATQKTYQKDLEFRVELVRG